MYLDRDAVLFIVRLQRLNVSHQSTEDTMYTHPETARLLTAQRVQERRAQAHAHRLAVQARSARRPVRNWLAWLPRLSSDRSLRRPAVAYPEPRRA
jgi:hypothetical protein